MKVAAWNSTVNGYCADAKRDARYWLNGWRSLAMMSKRIYKDSMGCGEYLHVPLKGKGADGRVYRVRCRFAPGKKYKGREVINTTVERRADGWHWLIETRPLNVGRNCNG